MPEPEDFNNGHVSARIARLETRVKTLEDETAIARTRWHGETSPAISWVNVFKGQMWPEAHGELMRYREARTRELRAVQDVTKATDARLDGFKLWLTRTVLGLLSA